jgi:taurine dioxygenase
MELVFQRAPLGHEVKGVDVRYLDNAAFAEIEAAYDRYGVIVLRGQTLTPAEQIAFSRRFGPLERFVLDRFNMPEYPEVFVLLNIIENGRPVGMDDAGRYWHSDMWITQHPPRGSILYAKEVPHDESGEPLGDTCFASSAHAYDTLPEDLKAKIEDLSAVFSARKYAAFVGHDKPKNDTSKEIVEAQDSLGDRLITHRLVRRHPRTARKCLYVVEGVISHIVGMDPEQSAELIDKLLRHMVRDDVVYRHRWRIGDLVLWDNYSAMHRAIGNFALPQRRLMHRTTLGVPVESGGAAPASTTMAM